MPHVGRGDHRGHVRSRHGHEIGQGLDTLFETVDARLTSSEKVLLERADIGPIVFALGYEIQTMSLVPKSDLISCMA